MFFEYFLAVTHLMSFILFLYVSVIVISLRILKENPRVQRHKKPKIELEAIFGL